MRQRHACAVGGFARVGTIHSSDFIRSGAAVFRRPMEVCHSDDENLFL
jgi:hypothetical protein